MVIQNSWKRFGSTGKTWFCDAVGEEFTAVAPAGTLPFNRFIVRPAELKLNPLSGSLERTRLKPIVLGGLLWTTLKFALPSLKMPQPSGTELTPPSGGGWMSGCVSLARKLIVTP